MKFEGKSIVRVLLFFIILVFGQKSLMDYDNVIETNDLAKYLFPNPYITIIASIIILAYVVKNLKFNSLIIVFPFLLTQGFEAYNRFYLVLFPLLFFTLLNTKLFKIFSISWTIFISTFQPLNLVLLIEKVLRKYKFVYVLSIGVVAFVASAFLLPLLDYLAPFSDKFKLLTLSLSTNSCWNGDGNTGFYGCLFSLRPLLYLFSPLMLGFNLDLFYFQCVAIFFLLSKQRNIWIFLFFFYTLTNHNLASFYRNFFPIYLFIELIMKLDD